MATKKAVAENKTPEPMVQEVEQAVEPTVDMFSKAQILASARFRDDRDLVDALLSEEKSYTMEQVDNEMKKYLKGKVK